jgi:hypothetical protein
LFSSLLPLGFTGLARLGRCFSISGCAESAHAVPCLKGQPKMFFATQSELEVRRLQNEANFHDDLTYLRILLPTTSANLQRDRFLLR